MLKFSSDKWTPYIDTKKYTGGAAIKDIELQSFLSPHEIRYIEFYALRNIAAAGRTVSLIIKEGDTEYLIKEYSMAASDLDSGSLNIFITQSQRLIIRYATPAAGDILEIFVSGRSYEYETIK